MIEIIKEKISKNYNLDENKWFFVSCFDINNNLILSNWVLITDKSLNKVIDMIYHWLIEKNNNIKTISGKDAVLIFWEPVLPDFLKFAISF